MLRISESLMLLGKSSHIFGPRKGIIFEHLTFLKTDLTFLVSMLNFCISSAANPWCTLYNSVASTCKSLWWIVTDLSILA